MATRVPALIQLSDPRVAAQLVVNYARADALFATLKAIVDNETSTISSTISLRVAGPLGRQGRRGPGEAR